MREIILCLTLIILLFLLFEVLGKLAAALLHLRVTGIPVLLFGVFIYFGLFQLVAVPMIMLKQSLTLLCIGWMVVLGAVLLLALYKLRQNPAAPWHPEKYLAPGRDGFWITFVKLLMLMIMALQFYYIITSDYLGWDTSSYVGTIATSLVRNSMYLFNGESGKVEPYIDFRYALSGFYMHSAVWCRLLSIRAIYMAKLVQGGILSILSAMAVYQIGYFLFSGKRENAALTAGQIQGAASGMVIAATAINVFFQSIYSTSDFLLSRGLEAKAYCANLVLPCIFLYGIMLWRDSDSRESKVFLFTACFSSVAISMSALVTAPALATLMLLPVLLRRRTLTTFRYYLLCMLPNACYLLIYVLYIMGKIRIM